MRPCPVLASLAVALVSTLTLAAAEIGELPSAGDTSYAGVATVDATGSLVTWYSGSVDGDEGWASGMFDTTDIWQGTIDFSKIP